MPRTQRTRRRWHLRAAVVALVLPLLVALTPAAALASGPPDGARYTKNFVVTKERYFSTIKRCVQVTMRGSVSFTVRYANRWSAFYRSRQVNHPALTVNTYSSCVYGPRALKSSYKMSLTQWWASSSCSSGVSVGVGLPWGVSVSASPACSKAKTAHRSTTYTGATGSRTQYNSTTTVKFGDEYVYPSAWGQSYGGPGEVRSKLCFKASSSIVVYPSRLSGSDSWQPTLTPCVAWF